MNKVFILLGCFILISSCAKHRLKKQSKSIEEYLEEKNLVAEKTDDGIYFLIEKEGAGQHPSVNDRVTVHYRGYTLEDRIFDSSYERQEPSTFSLQDVIVGWQIGIPLFQEGGSGKLFIPSELAYGKNPPFGSVIGKNEVLIFDIELINIVK